MGQVISKTSVVTPSISVDELEAQFKEGMNYLRGTNGVTKNKITALNRFRGILKNITAVDSKSAAIFGKAANAIGHIYMHDYASGRCHYAMACRFYMLAKLVGYGQSNQYDHIPLTPKELRDEAARQVDNDYKIGLLEQALSFGRFGKSFSDTLKQLADVYDERHWLELDINKRKISLNIGFEDHEIAKQLRTAAADYYYSGGTGSNIDYTEPHRTVSSGIANLGLTILTGGAWALYHRELQKTPHEYFERLKSTWELNEIEKSDLELHKELKDRAKNYNECPSDDEELDEFEGIDFSQAIQEMPRIARPSIKMPGSDACENGVVADDANATCYQGHRIKAGDFTVIKGGLINIYGGQEHRVAVKSLRHDKVINGNSFAVNMLENEVAIYRHATDGGNRSAYLVGALGILAHTNRKKGNLKSISLVMDCADMSLDKLLSDIRAKKTTLTYSDATLLMEDMFRALYLLHSKGIIHRDLKPHNIFLNKRDGKWRARIGDFGISEYDRGLSVEQCIEEQRKDFMPDGTDGWRAPEVEAGYPHTEQSDVYVMGLICRELFTETGQYDAAIEERLSPCFREIIHEEENDDFVMVRQPTGLRRPDARHFIPGPILKVYGQEPVPPAPKRDYTTDRNPSREHSDYAKAIQDEQYEFFGLTKSN